MTGGFRVVSGYVLEELEAVWRAPASTADAAELSAAVAGIFGVHLDPAGLTTVESIGELAELVQAALNERRAAATAPPRSAEPAPLSAAQQRIWFMQQMAGDAPLYHVPARLTLTGDLSAPALRSALTDLLTRHDILRTVYPSRSGIPSTEVRTGVTLPLTEVSGDDVAKPAAEQAAMPFRLETDLPVRFLLVRRAADHHVLLATFHHIAVDGLALDLLAADLGALYRHHATGTPEPAAPAFRYADFARAERTAGPDAEAIAARRAALAGAPFPLELPTDFPRPRFQRFRGAAVTGEIETAGLRKLARGHKTTPFAVLLAGLAAVLSRAAGHPDVVIATPAAGRTGPQWRDVAGCFINMVPVRVTARPDTTGSELITAAATAAWQALEAQDLPFDELIRTLPRRRRVPPIAVMLSYQMAGAPIPFGAATGTLRVDRPPATAKYDLSLYAVADGPRIKLELEYDTDLYTATTAHAVLHAVRAQLGSLTADPGARLDPDRTSGFEPAAATPRTGG